MKRIIDAVVNGQGKALVIACAVGAMIAASFIVGTPNTGSAGQVHNFGNCGNYGGDGYCSWMCAVTGHDDPSAAWCCSGNTCHCW